MKPYVSAILIAFICYGCGKETNKLSVERPYATEIKRVRSFYQADLLVKRLKKMDIAAYTALLQDSTEESNRWYLVLTGAEKDSASAAKIYASLQEKHHLMQITLVTYNDFEQFKIMPDLDDVGEIAKIKAATPNLPPSVRDVLQQCPQSDEYFVDNVLLFSFPKAMPGADFSSFEQAAANLPRGIKKKDILNVADAFTEVIYKDNLYNDKVTVDVMRLTSNENLPNSGGTIIQSSNAKKFPEKPMHTAARFAAAVLESGNYQNEHYEPISLKAGRNYFGYKVSFTKDTVRNYFVLADENNEYAVLAHGSPKKEEELLQYLATMGKSDGLTAFNEFHNTFNTMPRCFEDGDVFLGMTTQVLGNDYARLKGYVNWSKALVGHTVASMQFYNSQTRQSWSYSVFDIINILKRHYIYDGMYSKHKGYNKTPMVVGNQTGFFVYEPAYLGGVSELNYPNGRYVMAVNGVNMTADELLSKALRFQSDENVAGEDLCKDRYFIQFKALRVTDSNTFAGHAFVVFIKEDNKNKMTVFDGAWGVYAEDKSLKGKLLAAATLLCGNVPAKVANDYKSHISTNMGFSIVVSKEEYEAALRIKNTWTNDYQLTMSDCISFIEAIARSIPGWYVPDRESLCKKYHIQVDLLENTRYPIKIDKVINLPIPKHFNTFRTPGLYISEMYELNKNSKRLYYGHHLSTK